MLLAACGDDSVATDGDTESSTTDGETSSAMTSPMTTAPMTTATPADSSGTDGADVTTDTGTTGEPPSTTEGSGTTADTGSSGAGSSGTGSSESGASEDGSSGSTGEASTSTGTTGMGSSSSAGDSGSSTGMVVPGCEGTCAFVGASTPNDAVVFDLGTGLGVQTIELQPEAAYPYDATIAPAGDRVWFVGASGDGVVVVDTASLTIDAQFSPSVANGYLVDVLFGPGGTEAYVASRDTAAVYVFDATSYAEVDIAATPDGRDAGKMALDPCTGLIHVVEWYGDYLMTYDPADGMWSTVNVAASVPGTSLWDLQVAPDGSALYVTDRGNDQVHVYDLVASGGVPSTPVASIDVGDDPWGIDITSDGGTLVVACEDSSNVWFVDTATQNTTTLALALDADPRDVDILPGDAVAVVPTGNVAGDDGIYVIDIATETITQTPTDPGATNSNVVATTPQNVACGG